MAHQGGRPASTAPDTKALAFYLPQYHPIPENDEWWGRGFTEWTNVTAARPLYPGHYQPHVPGELGYYDLRVPEVRQAQADLARSHGVSGFVYYHYWFRGRQLLNRPFDEVLASGEPDFPFALCWANEEWTRNWDGQSGRVLIHQEYSVADDLAHIRWLANAFADDRYIKIDGRPLMLVYRPGVLPDPRRLTDTWRAEAQRLGIPDLYLCWVDMWGRPPDGPEAQGFDATVAFMPFAGERLFIPVDDLRPHRILDYESAYEARLAEPAPPWKHFPSVMVGWDNTARYARSATIFEGATPDRYRRWLQRTVDSQTGVRSEENYLFVLAWNEWAEGNHLEPDRQFGRAFLEATRSVMLPDADAIPVAASGHREAPHAGSTQAAGSGPWSDREDTAVADDVRAHAMSLVSELTHDPDRLIVSLSTRANLSAAGRGAGASLHGSADGSADGSDSDPPPDSRCVALSVLDSDGLADSLAKLANGNRLIGAFLLLDDLEQLPDRQEFLEELSAWSLANGRPLLLASAPNSAHFDLGLKLLFGESESASVNTDDDARGHVYDAHRLEHLFTSSGWSVVGRNDVSSVRSRHFDEELHDALPEEMVGALRLLAETYNGHWAVEQFVWALEPRTVEGSEDNMTVPPTEAPGGRVRQHTDQQRATLDNFLASVGLLASEANRRAGVSTPKDPSWKDSVRRLANLSPRTASVYERARRRSG